MIEDDDIDAENPPSAEILRPNRKKIMILLLPLLIVIGVSVGIYLARNKNYDSWNIDYSIVQYDKDAPESVTAFFDLPEIKTSVKGADRNHDLRLKVNLELSSIDDIKIIEALTPRLNDVILGHLIELGVDEVSGSSGLYWLKEELLYRLNLSAAPVKIKKINFSVFELQK